MKSSIPSSKVLKGAENGWASFSKEIFSLPGKNMKRKFIFFFLLLLAFCLFADAGQVSDTILPFDQVKAGMKGKGKTVFNQGRPEEFDVEIIGVLHNWLPKRNLIVARLQSDVLKNTGVIEGMSGSPVYVEGKLIGAVAYSLGNFSKEAFAGITPIAEMLDISTDEGPSSDFVPQMPFTGRLTLEKLVELNKERFFDFAGDESGQRIRPLKIPLVFSGFSSRVFDKVKPLFSGLGFAPLRSGSNNQIQTAVSPSDLILQAGEPIAVQLVKGDLDVSAFGTVTHVDGNKILAFGHPFYNLGSVDFAMAKAQVLTVVPSLMSSFWLAASDITIGRFIQDRTSGILGELGKMPRFIPLNFNLVNSEGEGKEFKVQITNDKIFTPLLVNLAISNIIAAEERAIEDLTLELDGTIYLDNGTSIHLKDLFSGDFDTAAVDLSGLVTAVVYYLTTNEFEKLGIHRIDINIGVAEEVRFAFLEKVWLGKYEAKPGEIIPIKVYYRNFRGSTVMEDFSLPAPNLPSGSEFSLVVGDAISLQSIETSQYRTVSFVPRNLFQLIRMLNSLRKHNYIYFKIIAAKPGLFLRGEEMPNLPPSMKSMFSSPRAASSPPIEITRSTLGEYRHAIPYVFRGLTVIPVKIK
jgi:hypothetical protein